MATPLPELMVQTAQGMVGFAKDKFEVTLDYSPESIRELEVIAAKLYALRPKSWLMRKLFDMKPTNFNSLQCCLGLIWAR